MSKTLVISTSIIFMFIEDWIIRTPIRNTKFLFRSIKEQSLVLLFSFLGPISLYFDRIYRGLDPSKGITYLRHAIEKTSDGSVSSIFSVVGYVFCGLSFILLVLVVLDMNMKKIFRILGAIVVLYVVLSVSLLTGGRSTLFLLMGVTYTLGYLRLRLFKVPIKLDLRSTLISTFIFIFLGSYVLYVFKDRAELSGISAEEYKTAIIKHLHGEVITESDSENENLIYLQLTGAYFTHQFWIMEECLNMESTEKFGVALFQTWRNLFSKLPFIERPDRWSFSGYYLPMIAFFIFDFGIVLGAVLFLFFLSALLFICRYFFTTIGGVFGALLFGVYGYIVLFCNMISSTDIMMLPHIFLALFVVWPLIKLLAKLKIY